MVFQDEYLTPMNINEVAKYVTPTYNLLYEVKEPVKITQFLGVHDQFVQNKNEPHSKHSKNLKKTPKRHVECHESFSDVWDLICIFQR